MTTEEAIQIIEVAQGDCEWDAPIEYQDAFKMAIEALKAQDVPEITVGDMISRQGAIEALCSVCGYDCDKSEFIYDAPQDEQVILCPEHYVLTQLPSVQPERKKGEWIDKSGGIEGAWNYCSVCGEQAIDLYDFCPNCGADMRGESYGD